jgi:mRNA-degrading endonuclease toxin of MazEF toxin-antitoxin module
MAYSGGDVVKGPDLFGDHECRPYVCVSDDTHPFSDEEALCATVTTTRRSQAIPLLAEDFTSGGLPRESYVNPWTITSIRQADIADRHGQLIPETLRTIRAEAAGYLGVRTTDT